MLYSIIKDHEAGQEQNTFAVVVRPWPGPILYADFPDQPY